MNKKGIDEYTNNEYSDDGEQQQYDEYGYSIRRALTPEDAPWMQRDQNNNSYNSHNEYNNLKTNSFLFDEDENDFYVDDKVYVKQQEEDEQQNYKRKLLNNLRNQSHCKQMF